MAVVVGLARSPKISPRFHLSSGLNKSFDRWAVLLSYDEQSHLEVMDTMFFVGVNAGLLILLIFGLVSAKAKIKAGRKEII